MSNGIEVKETHKLNSTVVKANKKNARYYSQYCCLKVVVGWLVGWMDRWVGGWVDIRTANCNIKHLFARHGLC